MRLSVSPLLVGLTLVGAVPAQAQLRASRPPTRVQNNPRLMVANPHSFAVSDSAAAVRVGAGLREKVNDVADKWYKTVQRTQMNDALVQYGYPPDAVLPPLVARQLATQLQARAFVSSTLSRGDDGRVTVETRLLAGNDQTGFMVRMSQEANQSFEDLGKEIGDALKPAFNAMEDAKECNDLRSTDAKKASDAARKALKRLPNYGKAELCLALIALEQKEPTETIIGHFRNAIEGDRLSLEAWGGLLGQYQQANDTANIIGTYREILRVAPTNQTVREEALKWLVSANRPEVGEEVAREGLKLDPANTDLWDLLSTACLVQQTPTGNVCAVEALEQVFALDSAKADTTFYQKILFVASQDTTAPLPYLKWARNASSKYADNTYFLSELIRAYGYLGETDSLVSATRQLMTLDTTDVQPVLRAARALNAVKRYTEAMELSDYIERYGEDSDKRNMGVILANEAGLEILKVQPPDFPLLEAIGRKAVSLVPAGGSAGALANYILGIGLLGGIEARYNAVVESKGCEDVQTLEAYLGEVRTALTAGTSISEQFVTERLGQLEGYNAFIEQATKAYCKDPGLL